MAGTRKPTRKILTPLTSRLFSLTAQDNEQLASLAQDASDRLGRTISAAAIIRVLIRLAGKGQVKGDVIAEEIERELQAGRLWGSTPRK